MSSSSNIILLRHHHWLLKVLNLRAVVNDTDIYELRENHPVIIESSKPVTKIIISNGFHRSREIKITHRPGNLFFEIESKIDNVQLVTGSMLTILFFIIFILSGVHFFLIPANAPIFIFLWFFYIKRKDFILIHRLGADTLKT